MKRFLLAVGALVALALPSAASAAFTPPSDLACRASALRVDLLNLQPVVANNPYNPCVTDSKQLLSVPGIAGVVTGSTALTPSTNVGASAHAQVANLTLGALTGLALSADVITADAQTVCVAGSRAFTGSSSVANLVVNGTNYGVVTTPLDIPILIGTVHINSQVKTSAGIVQRGIWVQTTGVFHALLGDVVIAEADSGRARFLNQC